MGKRENIVETYLDKQVVGLGGLTRKYTSPGQAGVADRLVLLPGGRIVFVEVKSMTGKERPGQTRERARMLGLGFEAIVVEGKFSVDLMVAKINRGIPLC